MRHHIASHVKDRIRKARRVVKELHILTIVKAEVSLALDKVRLAKG
jgi:hypothetical protein